MPRPTSPTAARPSFDLTEGDLRALAALPPPYPVPRDARIRALLAAWWARTDRPALSVPEVRGAARTVPVQVRLEAATLARVDRERGEVTRGAWLRAVVEAVLRG